MKVSASESLKGQSGRESVVLGGEVSSGRRSESVLSCDEGEGKSVSRGKEEEGGVVLVVVGGEGEGGEVVLPILRVTTFTAAEGCGELVDRMCCRIRSM